MAFGEYAKPLLPSISRNFRENLRQEPNASDNLKTYFTLPLEAYPEAGVPNDSSQLISILEEVLFSAKEKEVESSHPS
jgi:hypothetical protein